MTNKKFDISKLTPKDQRKFGGEAEVHASAMSQVKQLVQMLDSGEAMSEWTENMLSGNDNPRTPEDEKKIKQEAVAWANKLKKQSKILKVLDLDFSKYDYYGGLTVYRHNKETNVSESFWGGKWGKMNVNIAEKAAHPLLGQDIDVFTNSQSDIDYMVEMAIDSESDFDDAIECITIIRKGDTNITLYTTTDGGIDGVGADLVKHVKPMLDTGDELHASDIANYLIKGTECDCEYALELYQCPMINYMYEINLDQHTINAIFGDWSEDYDKPQIYDTYNMAQIVAMANEHKSAPKKQIKKSNLVKRYYELTAKRHTKTNEAKLEKLKQEFSESDWDELIHSVPVHIRPMLAEQKKKHAKYWNK